MMTKAQRERAATSAAMRKFLRRSKVKLNLTDKQYGALAIGIMSILNGYDVSKEGKD